MIKIVKTDGKTEKDFLMSLKARSSEVDKKVTAIVGDIIDNVKQRGDAAVLEYTEKFDGKLPLYYEVPTSVVDEAVSQCDDALIQSLTKAANNIADFHKRQVQQSFMDAKQDGSVLGQTVRGLQRVGIYVPGGTAAYPSSVLMNAIPAKIAGVEEIVMVTPPLKDGTPNKNILAAAKIAGVDKIFMCGGAQAVAALAYGTEKMPKVDKIVGPGNIFVATAKRMLYGVVDIDMIAGPSEILIIADSTANPKFLAADLMSQAEHDMLASAILITTDEKLAQQTNEQLKIQSAKLSRKCYRSSQQFNGRIWI